MWWNSKRYEYSNSVRCSECLMDRFVWEFFFSSSSSFFQRVKIQQEFLGRLIDNNGILFDMRDNICSEMFNFITIPSDISLSWEYPSFREVTKDDCLVSSRGYGYFVFSENMEGRLLLLFIAKHTRSKTLTLRVQLFFVRFETKNFLTIS